MMDSVSPLSVLLALVLGGVLLLWALQYSQTWRGATKSGARLPKGSFGWPVIGETIQFAKQSKLFGTSHVKRYGSVFKSYVLMTPTILGSTPDFAKFILGNPKLFSIAFPPMVHDILGSNLFVTQDGPRHTVLKKIVIKPLLPEALKTKVGVLDDIILRHLSSWAEQGTVVSKIKAKEMTLDVSIFVNVGLMDLGKTTEGREFLRCFELLNDALYSVPLKFPGTAFWKGFKGKARLSELIKKVLNERKEQKNHLNNDVLGALLSARDDEEASREVKEIDDELIADNIIPMLIGAYESTSGHLVWALKYMNDYPDVYRRLQAEHQGIRNDKARSLDGPRLNWEDIKKMEYTRKFVLEVLRILSKGAYYSRRAIEDVEYKGLLIPKGWMVGIMHHYLHNDPASHLDPNRFDPDRFDVVPKPLTFMPFSIGSHICPGSEVAKLFLTVAIHHLCATFKHESAAPDEGIAYDMPVTGYPVKVSRL